jgi:hypothetical protein
MDLLGAQLKRRVDMIPEGPIQTRVFDYLRLLTMIERDYRNAKRSWSVNPLTEAINKGYVPRSLVGRGNIQRRREIAIAHMSYVKTLLLSGGVTKGLGEEIVVGWITFVGTDKCGCPKYLGSAASNFISGIETAVICIHNEEE